MIDLTNWHSQNQHLQCLSVYWHYIFFVMFFIFSELPDIRRFHFIVFKRLDKIFWVVWHYNFSIKNNFSHVQAWQERKREVRGHHSPSSIQGELLAIDDQKMTLASLCLASYLAVNWLWKLGMKHSVYYAGVISVLMCVCVCVCVYMVYLSVYQSNLSLIYL